MKDEKEREFGGEERKEPLRCIHVILDTVFHQMIPQIGQILFNKAVKLIQTKM